MVDKGTGDPLIGRIGTHGTFQFRTFFIVQFVGVFAAWQLLVSLVENENNSITTLSDDIFDKAGSFFLPETDYWCSPTELGLSRGQRPASTISPIAGEGNKTDHCSVFDLDFSSINITDFSGVDENTRECTRCVVKAKHNGPIMS